MASARIISAHETKSPERVYSRIGAWPLSHVTVFGHRFLDTSPTRLLVLVLNDPDRLDSILTGFLELGITGATVVHTEGMGRILSDDIPIFAGLRAVVGDERPRNVTVFSVVEQAVVRPALDVVKDICGDLTDPSTGIAFVLPVEQVVGLAPALGRAPGEDGGSSGENG